MSKYSHKFLNLSGNSPLSIIFKFIIATGLILGVIAFVLVLTRKCTPCVRPSPSPEPFKNPSNPKTNQLIREGFGSCSEDAIRDHMPSDACSRWVSECAGDNGQQCVNKINEKIKNELQARGLDWFQCTVSVKQMDEICSGRDKASTHGSGDPGDWGTDFLNGFLCAITFTADAAACCAAGLTDYCD